VPVLPRGGGTSQCGPDGQPARSSVECSKYMQDVVALDNRGAAGHRAAGGRHERLNARLRQHKLWFPVDVSTGDRATIAG